MADGGIGVPIGLFIMLAGLVLIIAFTSSDGAALGGAGLIVVGGMVTAISFDDRTDD